MAAVQCWEIIRRGPVDRAALLPEQVIAGGEPFEGRNSIAVILNPDTVEIVPPLIDWQVIAPVIGIAAEHRPLPRFHFMQHIGGRAHQRLQPRLAKAVFRCVMAGARKDWQATGGLDPPAKRRVWIEIKPDAAIVEHFGTSDRSPDGRPETGQALVTQDFIGKERVISRHGGAIRKRRALANREDHE